MALGAERAHLSVSRALSSVNGISSPVEIDDDDHREVVGDQRLRDVEDVAARSAIARAMLATIPLRFLPVVVTTARRPALRRSCSRHDAHSSARTAMGDRQSPAGRRFRRRLRPAPRSPRRRQSPPGPRAASRCDARPGATRARSARADRRCHQRLVTVDLDAVDDGDHRGVDGDVGLLAGRQRARHRDARGVAERDQHVVAGPGIEPIGAHHQIVGRLRARARAARAAASASRVDRRDPPGSKAAPAAASAPTPPATSPSTRPIRRRVPGTLFRPLDQRRDRGIAAAGRDCRARRAARCARPSRTPR